VIGIVMANESASDLAVTVRHRAMTVSILDIAHGELSAAMKTARATEIVGENRRTEKGPTAQPAKPEKLRRIPILWNVRHETVSDC
jgi:hypothetical protein